MATRRLPTGLVLSAAMLLLAGCAAPTAYAPAADDAGLSGRGFSEQRLETDRYRVAFSGNSLTPRETVETYLLYRAAEITLAGGHRYFRIVEQDTEAHTRYRTSVSGYGFAPYRYGYFPGTVPLTTDLAHPITRYDAVANVLVGVGSPQEGDDRTYDARDVVARLGPTIVRPETAGAAG